jgi:hypothetical protein
LPAVDDDRLGVVGRTVEAGGPGDLDLGHAEIEYRAGVVGETAVTRRARRRSAV